MGKTYTICKYKVTKAEPSYKPFDADLMIEFTDYTEATLVKNPARAFPEYVYSIAHFKKIVPHDGPPSKFTGNASVFHSKTTVPPSLKTHSLLEQNDSTRLTLFLPDQIDAFLQLMLRLLRKAH